MAVPALLLILLALLSATSIVVVVAVLIFSIMRHRENMSVAERLPPDRVEEYLEAVQKHQQAMWKRLTITIGVVYALLLLPFLVLLLFASSPFFARF